MLPLPAYAQGAVPVLPADARLSLLSEPGRCLEGNDPVDGVALGGAAFLDLCAGVTGQTWRLRPLATGGLVLTNDFLGPDYCLAPQQDEAGPASRPIARMRRCAEADARLIAEAVAPGGARLVLARSGPEGAQCLTGYKADRPRAAPGGAGMAERLRLGQAVFAPCRDSEAQIWAMAGATVAPGPAPRIAGTAVCTWDDGMGDNPLAFYCQTTDLGAGEGFRTSGGGFDFALTFLAEVPATAELTITYRQTSLAFGVFQLESGEGRDCWHNRTTAATFCIRSAGDE